MFAALVKVILALLDLQKGTLVKRITLPLSWMPKLNHPLSRMAKLGFLLIIVIPIIGVTVLFPRWSNANAPGYKLAKVERGPIVSTVMASGTITPITTVIVGSQLSGQIVEILADYNDSVTAGQILARLNSDQIRFKRDAAKADLDQARANQVMQEAKMAEAELILSRQARLKPTGAVSDASYDAARTAALVAKAQVQVNAARIDQMEAVLRQVEVDLANTDIRSPVNGVIIQRSVELGQTVAASLQSPTFSPSQMTFAGWKSPSPLMRPMSVG